MWGTGLCLVLRKVRDAVALGGRARGDWVKVASRVPSSSRPARRSSGCIFARQAIDVVYTPAAREHARPSGRGGPPRAHVGDEEDVDLVGLRAHVGMSATHNSSRPRPTKRRLTSSAGYASRGADVVLKDLIGAARLPVLCFQLADMCLLIGDVAALIAPALLHSAPRCATPVGGPLVRPRSA